MNPIKNDIILSLSESFHSFTSGFVDSAQRKWGNSVQDTKGLCSAECLPDISLWAMRCNTFGTEALSIPWVSTYPIERILFCMRSICSTLTSWKTGREGGLLENGLRLGKIKSVRECVTLGTKNKSALNLKRQSSKKWKRSDSISSPETKHTKQSLFVRYSYTFYFTMREREREK